MGERVEVPQKAKSLAASKSQVYTDAKKVRQIMYLPVRRKSSPKIHDLLTDIANTRH